MFEEKEEDGGSWALVVEGRGSKTISGNTATFYINI